MMRTPTLRSQWHHRLGRVQERRRGSLFTQILPVAQAIIDRQFSPRAVAARPVQPLWDAVLYSIHAKGLHSPVVVRTRPLHPSRWICKAILGHKPSAVGKNCPPHVPWVKAQKARGSGTAGSASSSFIRLVVSETDPHH